MNYRLIFNIIGRILCVEAAFMVPALIIALFAHESAAAIGFGWSVLATAGVGFALAAVKAKRSHFFARDGMAAVGLGWILVSVFGALPMYFSGAIPAFVDACFETVSGFTTTGSTILADIEALPMSVSYWRSFTHWLGGMGVLVFVLAIGPKYQKSGETLYVLRAESPGPVVGKLVPRMQQTAVILYKIYIAMTLVQIVLLCIFGMPLFDAVTITFGTAGTGGFAIKNDSLASYGTVCQAITTLFMVLFSINFALYYLLLIKDFRSVWKNEELRVFLGIIVLAVAAIAIDVYPIFGSALSSVHHSAFQVASIMSTTGYMTADFDLWPQFSRTLLFLLMFVGAMAGSTGGGLKVVRISIIIKAVRRSIASALHPNSVNLVHMDGERVDEDVVNGVKEYMLIYILIMAGSVLLLSIDPFVDFEASVTAVVTCLNNVGPGLGLVGPTCNFAEFSVFSKLLLSADMLLGRLELFPILILACPSAWKK